MHWVGVRTRDGWHVRRRPAKVVSIRGDKMMAGEIVGTLVRAIPRAILVSYEDSTGAIKVGWSDMDLATMAMLGMAMQAELLKVYQ